MARMIQVKDSATGNMLTVDRVLSGNIEIKKIYKGSTLLWPDPSLSVRINATYTCDDAYKKFKYSVNNQSYVEKSITGGYYDQIDLIRPVGGIDSLRVDPLFDEAQSISTYVWLDGHQSEQVWNSVATFTGFDQEDVYDIFVWKNQGQYSLSTPKITSLTQINDFGTLVGGNKYQFTIENGIIAHYGTDTNHIVSAWFTYNPVSSSSESRDITIDSLSVLSGSNNTDLDYLCIGNDRVLSPGIFNKTNAFFQVQNHSTLHTSISWNGESCQISTSSNSGQSYFEKTLSWNPSDWPSDGVVKQENIHKLVVSGLKKAFYQFKDLQFTVDLSEKPGLYEVRVWADDDGSSCTGTGIGMLCHVDIVP